jgi:predicted NBD/HSP70 family sugar kinase
MPSDPTARVQQGPGPGRVLEVIATGRGRTRSDIALHTGLSRPTVSQRLETLVAAGLVRESEESLHSGGRPAKVLELNERAGVVLCADIGEERTRVALTDLRGRVLAERVDDAPVGIGPQALLDRIATVGRELLPDAGFGDRDVAGIGISLPGPVDFGTGRTIGWSVMAGWDGYDVRAQLGAAFAAPVLVDNDVNLLTLAEHRLWWPGEPHLLYVKAGTGIGSGMIVQGRINRGSLGAAGDIGHARLSGYGDPQCRCGNRGCLEALVGGWALARDLDRRGGSDVHDARDVVRQVGLGSRDAVAIVRDAGRTLGEAVAYATSLLNPGVIVIGGMLAGVGDHLIAGVREIVYQRALPLATKQLRIAGTQLDEHGGVTGAAHLVLDSILAPAEIDRALATGSGRFSVRNG